MPRYFKLTSFLLIVLLLCSILRGYGQSNLVFDTIILPGHTIQKVSASASSDVWFIEASTSKNVYRLDGSLILTNHSAAFQAATSSAFSDLLCVDTNEVVVGSFTDFAYYWKNSLMYKIKSGDGLTDSAINAIDGRTAGGMTPPFIGISTDRNGYSSTVNYKTYAHPVTGQNLYKLLELGTATPVGPYALTKVRAAGGDLLSCTTSSSVFPFSPDPQYQLINTATSPNYTAGGSGVPNVLAGTDSGLVYRSPSGIIGHYLSGKKINKVIKYGTTDILVGSDSLYIFNYNSTPPILKCAYPKNKYKVNDIDISPQGCIWLATDSGLVRLKDINCANFKSAIVATDTSLIYVKSCTVDLNTSCTGCANFWHWDFGDLTSALGGSQAHTYPQSGTYLVKMIASNGVCTDTVSRSIHVLKCCDSSYFSYSTLQSQVSLCSVGPKTLDAGIFASCHYLWSTGDTTHAIQAGASGIYWVKITTAGGCSSTDTIVVAVIPKPVVTFTGLAAAYCSNLKPVVLHGSPSTGVFAGSGMSGDTLHPSTAGGGTHPIIFTYTGPPGCSGADTQSVIIHIAPVVSFTPLAATYCLNADSVKLIGVPRGGLFSGLGMRDTIFRPSIAGVGKDTIRYFYTDANGCSDSAKQGLLVLPIPTVTSSGLAPQYCITNPPVTLSGLPIGGSFNGQGVTGTTFSPGSAPGSDTVVYSFTAPNGCKNTSEQFTTVFQQPTVTVLGPAAICAGNSTMLYASGNGTFSWSTGQTGDSILVHPTATTTYSVTVTNICGSASNAYILGVNALPVVDISRDTLIQTGTSAELSASGGGTYTWAPPSELSCPSCSSTKATPPQTTIYCVLVKDNNGCSKTACVTVNVEDLCLIYVPNAFTPGRGGVNSMECVMGHCIQSMTFEIFDRWGEKVFESNEPSVCWDGTYKGELLSSAVFVYRVDAVMTNGAHIKKKGNISLIR
jgi:gliding motility-associated-like protein